VLQQQINKEKKLDLFFKVLEMGSANIEKIQKEIDQLLCDEYIKANVATIDNKALRMAACRGYLSIVKKLLTLEEVKKNITANNNWVIKGAAGNGKWDVVIELAKASSEVAEYLRSVPIWSSRVFNHLKRTWNLTVDLKRKFNNATKSHFPHPLLSIIFSQSDYSHIPSKEGLHYIFNNGYGTNTDSMKMDNHENKSNVLERIRKN